MARRCYLPPRRVPLAGPLQPPTTALPLRYSSPASYENTTHSLRCQKLPNPNPVSTIRGQGPASEFSVSRNDVHTVLRRLQWNSRAVMVIGWHLHRHRLGLQFRVDTTNTGWGLLSGHQRGPRPGHQWGLSHGHGQDAEFIGNLRDRCALGVSVQLYRVPFELVGIILPCHRCRSSRFPRQSCGIQRVQHPGSGSFRHTAVRTCGIHIV